MSETWQGNLVVQGVKNLADAVSTKVRTGSAGGAGTSQSSFHDGRRLVCIRQVRPAMHNHTALGTAAVPNRQYPGGSLGLAIVSTGFHQDIACLVMQ